MIPAKIIQIAATQVSAYPIVYALDEFGQVWVNRYGRNTSKWDGWEDIREAE